jgi:AAA family ATP:ADP antiporter
VVQRLQRFLDIRPGEGAPTALSFLHVACVVASFLLAKPIRNGLFLNEYGPYALVYVYAGVPAALSLFVPLYNRIAARVGHRRLVVISLWFFCVNVLLFWYAFRFAPFRSLPAIFYVWVNCYGIVAPVQAWSFAAAIFDTRQAKRLFGLIGSGASLGAIAGGLLGKTLVGPVGGTVNLLLVLAALIAMAALGVMAAARRLRHHGPARRRRARVPFRETVRTIGRTPYLRLLAALAVLVAIATQWIGFQFSLVADARFGGNADRLTEFFSGFNFYLGVAAFAIQLLATGPVLRRFGLSSTIVALPATLAIASVAIVAAPFFWPVVIASALDQGLRFSLDKASYELLYLPIPGAIRAHVKAAIDIVVNRAADAAGAVLLGIATKGFIMGGLDLELRGTAALNLIVIAAWLGVTARLRREYVVAIRDNIHTQRIDSERARAAALDRAIAEALAAKLAAREPADVLYALDLLEAQPHPAHPALRGLLSHPSAPIRRRAIALVSAASDRSAKADVEALLTDPDLETRTEALLYLSRHFGVDPVARIQAHGDFADFSIRAGMVAFLASQGPAQNLDAVQPILDGMIAERGDAGRRARTEAARLLERLPLPADPFDAHVERLLAPEETDPGVLRFAIRAAGRYFTSGAGLAARRSRHLAGLVTERLGHPQVGADAVEALGRLGDAVIGYMRERLQDPDVPPEVKREIPAVLVRVGTPAAERALVETLVESDPTLRHRIIAALNKLRQRHPDVPIDPHAVEMLLAAEIFGHYRSYQVLRLLGDRLAGDDPVIQGLTQSMEQEVERIFRLLALLYPHEDLHSAYFGLRSSTPSLRADALEFLEHVLPPHLRQMLVPLLDSQVPLDERVRLADALVGAQVRTLDEAVGMLLASEDPWLRSCAAFAVGALRLETLAPELERLTEAKDPLLRETARAARRRLAGEPAVEAPEEPQEEWAQAQQTGIQALGG